MLMLVTSVKVRLTKTYMCEISSILLKFCARFWQISSKMFVIPPQISSIFSAWKEWQPCNNWGHLFCNWKSQWNHLLGNKNLSIYDKKSLRWNHDNFLIDYETELIMDFISSFAESFENFTGEKSLNYFMWPQRKLILALTQFLKSESSFSMYHYFQRWR